MCGPMVSVWVRVMCRRRLLDTRRAHPPVRLVSFMSLSRLTVTPWCLVPFTLCILRLNLMPLRVATRGNSEHVRNITVTLCPPIGILAMLRLLITTCLFRTLLRLVSDCSVADPL